MKHRHTKRGAGFDEDVRHVLVLADEGKVEQNLQRLGVCRENDDLSGTTIQRLRRLVRTCNCCCATIFVQSSLYRKFGGRQGFAFHKVYNKITQVEDYSRCIVVALIPFFSCL